MTSAMDGGEGQRPGDPGRGISRVACPFIGGLLTVFEVKFQRRSKVDSVRRWTKRVTKNRKKIFCTPTFGRTNADNKAKTTKKKRRKKKKEKEKESEWLEWQCLM